MYATTSMEIGKSSGYICRKGESQSPWPTVVSQPTIKCTGDFLDLVIENLALSISVVPRISLVYLQDFRVLKYSRQCLYISNSEGKRTYGKLSKRSLIYEVRNAWFPMARYASTASVEEVKR
jgi:hypothetical protein